jgi:integrase/recombinase XerC
MNNLARSTTLPVCDLPPDQNPAAVYVAGYPSGNSKRTMIGALDRIAEVLGMSREQVPWHLLRAQHTQAIRAELAAKYAPASANLFLTAMKGVLRQAWRLGLISTDDYEKARDFKPIHGERLPSGRNISKQEMQTLFKLCSGNGVRGVRDAAILALLYGAGLRRHEATSLNLDQYDPNLRQLTVIGKGNKERVVPLPVGSATHVDRWIKLRGLEPGPLLYPMCRGGCFVARRMTDGVTGDVLERLYKLAGFNKITPHDMRRTFVGDMLDAGADISSVQQIVGHAVTSTTQRYDRRPDAAKRKAADLLDVPVFDDE